jgi:hypothetical protein
MAWLEWLGGHWHEVALFLITGIVAVIYALDFIGKHLPRGARKLVAPETTSLLALFFIVALVAQVESVQHTTSRELQVLSQRMLEIQQDRAAGYLVTDDPALLDVFGPEIQKVRQNATLLRNHEIQMVNVGAYSEYYKRMLQRFRGRTFLAITLPNRDIWRDRNLYDHMKRFTRQEHGTIRRIFIVDAPDAISPADKEIINRHLEAGVRVMLATRSHVDTDKQLPLIVESTGAFGWQTELGPNNALNGVLASTNPAVTSGWIRTFNAVADDAVPLDRPLR